MLDQKDLEKVSKNLYIIDICRGSLHWATVITFFYRFTPKNRITSCGSSPINSRNTEILIGCCGTPGKGLINTYSSLQQQISCFRKVL